MLKKLRGGKPLRVPFRDQILSTLASDGKKKTGELVAAIDGHPKAIKNELSRLVEAGEIVRIRWGVYALPSE
jgi:DeoR/GlpR family transcriptional regulator of sugar metabolism